MLDALLQAVEFSQARDRLFALGDLVDRGPDGAALLEMTEKPWFFSLKGNHEVMFVESQRNWKVRMMWSQHGNEWSERIPAKRLARLVELASALPLMAEVKLPGNTSCGLVHAEVPENVSWKEARQRMESSGLDLMDQAPYSIEGSLLWGRQRFLAAREHRAGATVSEGLRLVRGIDSVITGHSVTGRGLPIQFGNQFFIETGAYLPNGAMTLLELGAWKFSRVLRDGAAFKVQGPQEIEACGLDDDSTGDVP